MPLQRSIDRTNGSRHEIEVVRQKSPMLRETCPPAQVGICNRPANGDEPALQAGDGVVEDTNRERAKGDRKWNTLVSAYRFNGSEVPPGFLLACV